MINFRPLTARETECRIGQVKENYVILLLYKNARADMDILDDTVGDLNWQRKHEAIKGNMYCHVGINRNYDVKDAPPDWVWKSDCGTESNTEAEKGESSDSFKRACVNWGIGRELYTAPIIQVTNCNIKNTGRTDKRGKPIYTCYDSFAVRGMAVEEKRIVALVISRWDYKSGKWVDVFTYDERKG